jgi:hypothetical protein
LVKASPPLFLNIVDHQEVFTYTGRKQELVNPRELILWDIYPEKTLTASLATK